MPIGTQLRRASLDAEYDTIIIGSGMSGLASAAILAKSGHKVLVLERHYTAGGFTHTFTRKAYEWDVGVHYIGEVHKKHSMLRRIFDYISDEGIQWAEMTPVYDRIWIGSESFDYVKGEKVFRAQMLQYFPEEEAAIDAYLKLIRKVSRAAPLFFMGHIWPQSVVRWFEKKLKAPFLTYASQTSEEVLSRLTSNKKLIAVLTGQWGDYGLPPRQSSFAMHALVAKHYLGGASYPVGGSSVIASSIEAVLQKHGGQIITSAEVASLLTERERAVGVQLADGRQIKAKNVISSIGVYNTAQRLLPESSQLRQDLVRKVEGMSRSMAHIGLYIGLDGDLEQLGIPSSNLWIYKDEQHSKNFEDYFQDPNLEFPAVYISFPSSKDPTWRSRHPGKSTIEIVVPVAYGPFERWSKKRWQKRGVAYEEFKAEVTAHLLSILMTKYPLLKDHIAYTELSTPLSTAHFNNYSQGEIYGINHDPKRFAQAWLRPDTSLRNFYLTGQDIVTCGVGGALSAGVLTSMRILGPWKSRQLLRMFKRG